MREEKEKEKKRQKRGWRYNEWKESNVFLLSIDVFYPGVTCNVVSIGY
jgi:hypothetical protein